MRFTVLNIAVRLRVRLPCECHSCLNHLTQEQYLAPKLRSYDLEQQCVVPVLLPRFCYDEVLVELLSYVLVSFCA